MYTRGALVTFLGSLAFVCPALAQSCDPTWMPTSMQTPVGASITDSVMLPNGDLIVIGDFQEVAGVAASRIARWDGTAWHPFGSGLNGVPREITLHPAGGFVVCGAFTQADGVSASNIARWNGSWSALGAGRPVDTFNLTVDPAGNVFAVGNPAVSPTNLARWDGTTWTAIPTTFSNPFWNIADIAALPNGSLFVGGYFQTINSIPVNGRALWNGSTWSPVGPNMTINDSSAVGKVAVDTAGNIYLATYGGIFSLTGVWRWDGSAWSALTEGGAPFTGLSEFKVHTDGRLFISSSTDATPIWPPVQYPLARYVYVWNGAWSTIATDYDSASPLANSIEVLPNGDLLALGTFSTMNYQPIERIARRTGAGWQAFATRGTAPSSMVNALATLPDGRVMAGGTFLGLGDAAAQRIGIWDGAAWAIPAGFTSTGHQYLSRPSIVQTLHKEPSGSILAGGVNFYGVYRWTGSGWAGLPSSHSLGFYNIGTGFIDPGEVYAIHTLADGSVIVGGNFNPEGLPGPSYVLNNIARHTGTEWVPMGSGLSQSNFSSTPYVYALLTLSNGDIIAGGAFTRSGTTNIQNLARWDGSAWSEFAGGITGTVRALARTSNGDIIAAGLFTSAGGVPLSNIARWNGTTWLPLGSGTNGRVNALHFLPNGDLLAGGFFTTAGGVPATGIALWDGSTWSAVSSGASSVNAITQRPNADIVLGGNFSTAGGNLTPFFTTVTLPPASCPCDTVDFNHDTLFPDTQDIADFLTVFAGGVCFGQVPTEPPCNTDIDFNNDGLLPDTLDIDSLLSVFSGGPCL